VIPQTGRIIALCDALRHTLHMADTPTPSTWRRLQELRTNQGHTLTTLARAAEISLPYLSQLESGQRRGRPPIHKRLADALGVEVRDLTADIPNA
jgi:transcriptional regulator with XRE-family HTH domain